MSTTRDSKTDAAQKKDYSNRKQGLSSGQSNPGIDAMPCLLLLTVGREEPEAQLKGIFLTQHKQKDINRSIMSGSLSKTLMAAS